MPPAACLRLLPPTSCLLPLTSRLLPLTSYLLPLHDSSYFLLPASCFPFLTPYILHRASSCILVHPTSHGPRRRTGTVALAEGASSAWSLAADPPPTSRELPPPHATPLRLRPQGRDDAERAADVVAAAEAPHHPRSCRCHGGKCAACCDPGGGRANNIFFGSTLGGA